MFNFQKICQKVVQGLPERTETVILRRFGLRGENRETLEAIGKSHGITRERIRQIEKDGVLKIKPRIENYQEVFQSFNDQLKDSGELKKEDVLLKLLGGSKFQNHIFFLLTLSNSFKRFSESEEFYSLWTINSQSLKKAQKVVDSFHNHLLKENQPLKLKDYKVSIPPQHFLSYLEISKKIYQGPEEKFGLKHWPEINPRGIKDKAYLVLKKEEKPLHFSEVAQLISKTALPQTVHNELIKDERFILVGRGLYALGEWGYEPGVVKDIILKILENAKNPLNKEEITKEVLKQRFVKETTVLLNLNNPEYFQKTSQGKYLIKTV